MNSTNIASPEFWIDADGNHPSVLTVVTKADVESGRWKPVDGNVERAIKLLAPDVSDLWPKGGIIQGT